MTPALKGNDFLLKIATVPTGTNYITVAAMRTTSLALNKSVIDTTNKSSQGWSESLPGGGVKSVSISASGILVDEVSVRSLLDMFLNNAIARGTITFPSNPVATNTIVLNGVTITFGTTVAIAATLAGTLQNLYTYLKASTNPLLTVATYDVTDTQLLIKHKTAGTAGNAYTLARTGTSVLSGATLTGGGTSTHWNAQIVYGTGDYWQGAFMSESFGLAGDQNDVETYEIALSSSDAVTYVDAP